VDDVGELQLVAATAPFAPGRFRPLWNRFVEIYVAEFAAAVMSAALSEVGVHHQPLDASTDTR
jgi:hypothetical protein